MKKFFILPALLLGVCFPAGAQQLTPANQALLKNMKQHIRQQLPSVCINGHCYSTRSEALAYCAGVAEAVLQTQNLPAGTEKTLQDTLNTCQALLQEPPQECAAPEALAAAKEAGKISFWQSLITTNQAVADSYAQVDYVDGYRQLGQEIKKGAQKAARIYKQGYQNMASGYANVSYTDGYRQIAEGLADTYKDGYQNMAEGYTKVSYTDGYRQIAKGLADTYKDGYQNMGKGYTKVSYTDGYRQLWQAIKNFVKKACHTQVKADMLMWKEFQKAHQ